MYNFYEKIRITPSHPGKTTSSNTLFFRNQNTIIRFRDDWPNRNALDWVNGTLNNIQVPEKPGCRASL